MPCITGAPLRLINGWPVSRPPPAAEAGSDEAASLLCPFQQTYSAEDYLVRPLTQARTGELGPEKAAHFPSLVRTRLEALGRPPRTATFVAYLAITILREATPHSATALKR